MKKALWGMLLVAACLLSAGCTQYYRVTEPKTGKVYYTNSWDAGRYSWTGTARFRDMGTGKEVTLQDTEVEVVSKEEAEQYMWSAARNR